MRGRGSLPVRVARVRRDQGQVGLLDVGNVKGTMSH
jgi:hypothetical protein